jgi:hypothetical protein
MYSYVNNEVSAPVLGNKKFEEDSNFENIFNNSIVLLLISLVILGSFVFVFLIYSKIRYV